MDCEQRRRTGALRLRVGKAKRCITHQSWRERGNAQLGIIFSANQLKLTERPGAVGGASQGRLVGHCKLKGRVGVSSRWHTSHQSPHTSARHESPCIPGCRPSSGIFHASSSWTTAKWIVYNFFHMTQAFPFFLTLLMFFLNHVLVSSSACTDGKSHCRDHLLRQAFLHSLPGLCLWRPFNAGRTLLTAATF